MQDQLRLKDGNRCSTLVGGVDRGNLCQCRGTGCVGVFVGTLYLLLNVALKKMRGWVEKRERDTEMLSIT